jgi:hypothetical protein
LLLRTLIIPLSLLPAFGTIYLWISVIPLRYLYLF